MNASIQPVSANSSWQAPGPKPVMMSTEPTCLNKPSGHVPSADEFTTMRATVVDIQPDRYNPRNGLGHQVLFVKVSKIMDGPTTADHRSPTPTSVKGEVIEVDNDISPCIGTKAPVSKGQQIYLKGVLYHDEARGDKPASDGIHWTHHADVNGDAGYVKVAVHGKLKTLQ